jgi:hypothetical protein
VEGHPLDPAETAQGADLLLLIRAIHRRDEDPRQGGFSAGSIVFIVMRIGVTLATTKIPFSSEYEATFLPST